MKCIYCGTPLSAIDYCTGCGADITIQKRIIRISNLLYNQGLEKATVRDLSGAIVCLKRSLKFNKENVDARNLLGLVYFETGEVVSALSEWVISKNMNVPNNAADIYIEKLQANKNKLDMINQTIRKYNQALYYCRQDNEDMAMIQLKKVLQQNPKLIKAYHLLALLYLKRHDYEKARKLLRKAAHVDTTNTTTLRYLKEVEEATGISTSLDVKRKKKYAKDTEKVNKLTGVTSYMSGNELIIQPTTFRDSSAVATFINIFLGFALGAAIVWFLVVPGTKQSIHADVNQQVTAANSKMAAEVARVQGLEKEIEDYKQKVKAANQTRDEAEQKVASYDELMKAADAFLAGNQVQAAEALNAISEDSLTGTGKDLYGHLKDAASEYMYTGAYNAGTVAYTNNDFDTAITELKKASEAKPNDWNAKWYLAWAYRNKGDNANADKVFNELLQLYPARESEITPYMMGTGGGAPADEPEGEPQGDTPADDPQGDGGDTPTDDPQGDGGTTPEE